MTKMKLRHAATSPYVRKVMVVAHETGLADRIELVATSVSPVAPGGELALENPLAKIPALTTEGGEVLYDSRVIAEYLDSLHDGTRLFPPSGGARWAALRRQALGDGISDAAVLTRYETFLRPEPKRWPEWIAGQKAKILGALDALEDEAPALAGAVTIGHIAIACALGYLDFRFADLGWRGSRPALGAWYDGFARRASMIATAPKS